MSFLIILKINLILFITFENNLAFYDLPQHMPPYLQGIDQEEWQKMQGQLPKTAPNSVTTLDIMKEILKTKGEGFKKKKKDMGGITKSKNEPCFQAIYS